MLLLSYIWILFNKNSLSTPYPIKTIRPLIVVYIRFPRKTSSKKVGHSPSLATS